MISITDKELKGRFKLNDKQIRFIKAYYASKNQLRSYFWAYSGCSYETARINASRLLANANVQDCLNYLEQEDLAFQAIITNESIEDYIDLSRYLQQVGQKLLIVANEKLPINRDNSINSKAIAKLSTRELRDLAASIKDSVEIINHALDIKHSLVGADTLAQHIGKEIKEQGLEISTLN